MRAPGARRRPAHAPAVQGDLRRGVVTAACPSGKRRYRDRVGAQLALAVIRRRGTARRRETRAYRCPACRGWHLTSQQQRTN
ncbi:hypothetical protein E4P36_04965 [Streptomyces sp. 4R-3d]|nr:hypothetical protein E4P36_04965 [Streptomyces sp. 4R-3d]